MNKYTATFASVLSASMLDSWSASGQEWIRSAGSEASRPAILVVLPDLGTGLGGQAPIHAARSRSHPIGPPGTGFIGRGWVVARKIRGYRSSDIRVDIINLSRAKFRLYSSSNFSKSTTGD